MCTIVPCLSVLTRTQTLFQEVPQMLMVHCFTTLKLAVQECLVHLMIMRRSSHVQFAPNKQEQFVVFCTVLNHNQQLSASNE